VTTLSTMCRNLRLNVFFHKMEKCCLFICVLVCVYFEVRCSAHKKKGESVMTPNFNNMNLSHPFTGTTLHTPLASKSTERFLSSLSFPPPPHGFSSLSVSPPLSRRSSSNSSSTPNLASSHKTHCRLYYLDTLSFHKNIPPPPTTQQPT
jgi:hypothetical protein